MKRNRRAEGEAILRRAENTLRESLAEILPEVVASGEPLFFNSQFNPHSLPAHLLSKDGEALLQASSACVEMREALGLPGEGSVAELFLASCTEAASSNPHRRGPKQLAAALLERLAHVA
jgi:hypothetical protein